MKNALRCPAVAARIMKNALTNPVGTQDARNIFIPVQRQGKEARHSRAIQNKRMRRQTRHGNVLQVIEKECLNALVGRTNMIRQQSFLLPELGNQ